MEGETFYKVKIEIWESRKKGRVSDRTQKTRQYIREALRASFSISKYRRGTIDS